MLKQLFLLLGMGILFLWLLSACGIFPTSGSSTPTGNSSTNTSPGTQTSGPVTISTDHSIYQQDEHLTVIVRNTLSTAIYALDTKASCSILEMEVLTNGTWQAANVARCSLGRPANRVEILPGHQYSATIQANTPGLDNLTFPAGTYRMVLHYSTNNQNITSATTSVPSASLTIKGASSSQLPPPNSGTPAIKDTPPRS